MRAAATRRGARDLAFAGPALVAEIVERFHQRHEQEYGHRRAAEEPELTGLRLGDVNFADQTVRVTGKGAKTRILPVGRFARAAVERWLGVRARFAAAQVTALFVGVRGERIKDTPARRSWLSRRLDISGSALLW